MRTWRAAERPCEPTRLERVLLAGKTSQNKLAGVARVRQSTLSRIVTGKMNPSVLTALRIARALNVSVEELWG